MLLENAAHRACHFPLSSPIDTLIFLTSPTSSAQASQGSRVIWSIQRRAQRWESLSMDTIPIFLVYKFFPPRCPRCEHPFSSVQDFVEYGGTGSSFGASKILQAGLFPEL